jgi:rhomboid-like protein
MIPVGYSHAFEGNPYHVLSFFLATGVLSGFAQHWSTLITPQRRPIPEIFIRCGGASGALLGILGVFCMQYPNAGLGIILLPFHFEAQYVLPAIMLFDFVGMVRGYSFVNFGHAVSRSTLTDTFNY